MNAPTISFGCKPTLAVFKAKDDGDRRRKPLRDYKKPGACFHCRKESHYKRDCLSDKQKDFALAVAGGVDCTSQWLLDSCSSRHLVTTAAQLHDPVE